MYAVQSLESVLTGKSRSAENPASEDHAISGILDHGAVAPLAVVQEFKDGR